jgi:hypothetical protein
MVDSLSFRLLAAFPLWKRGFCFFRSIDKGVQIKSRAIPDFHSRFVRLDGALDMSRIYDSPNTTPATVTRSNTTLAPTTRLTTTTTRQRGQKLTMEQKLYIVELLGCYRTPSQAAREFQASNKRRGQERRAQKRRNQLAAHETK